MEVIKFDICGYYYYKPDFEIKKYTDEATNEKECVICKRSFLISFISFFNANISSATRCASATPLFILMFFCRFILYLKSPTESVFKIAFECKSLSVNPEIFSSSSIRFFISFGYLCEG